MQKVHVKKDEIKLIGIQTRTNNLNEYFSASPKIAPCVMKFFQEQLNEKIPHRKNPGVTISAYTDYENDHTGDYTYFIGEEVTSFDNIPEGLSKLIIPAQNYTKFTNGPGAMPLVCITAWQQIWAMTNNELGGDRGYQTDFEYYDERAKDHQNTTLDIYIGLQN